VTGDADVSVSELVAVSMGSSLLPVTGDAVISVSKLDSMGSSFLPVTGDAELLVSKHLASSLGGVNLEEVSRFENNASSSGNVGDEIM
jgi:hypothetical protein